MLKTPKATVGRVHPLRIALSQEELAGLIPPVHPKSINRMEAGMVALGQRMRWTAAIGELVQPTTGEGWGIVGWTVTVGIVDRGDWRDW